MKKIVVLGLSAVLSMFLTVRCFADVTLNTDCRSFENFFDSSEFAEVVNDVQNDEFMEETGALSVYGSRGVSDTNAYKLYNPASNNFIKELHEGVNIYDLISDDYRWIVTNQNVAAMNVRSDDGKWNTIGYAEYLPENNGSVSIDKVYSAIAALFTGTDDEIKDIICVDCGRTYITSFVCVILSDNIYLLPFSSRPDFTGLENGEIYTVEEAYNTLSLMLGDSEDTIDGEYNIGGTGSVAKQTIPVAVIIIPIVAIAVGITAAVWVWEKRTKRNAK